MKQIVLLGLVLLTFGTFAQTRTKKKPAIVSEVVTNATIIDLAKAGLDKEVIISKINSSEASFDLSASGLIALKNQKVDNDIIKAMLNKANGTKTDVPASVAAKPVVSKSLPALDMVNQVYRYNPSANSVAPLEKTAATMKTKTKFLGYGGASVLYTIEGDKSPVRIMAADSAVFLIDAGGNALPDLSLYMLAVNKGARQATTQKLNGTFKQMGGNIMSGGAIIPINITRAGSSVYRLTPAKPLERGEYFFATKPVASASSVDVYAFGID